MMRPSTRGRMARLAGPLREDKASPRRRGRSALVRALITQFEMITSTELSGSGIRSMLPFRNAMPRHGAGRDRDRPTRRRCCESLTFTDTRGMPARGIRSRAARQTSPTGPA